jgi:hypothetical protein
MVRAELIQRSPLRILEKTTHGGLGKGNLGVITGREGVGKTAFLVHLATDQLFQGRHVIHVSFAGRTDHIIDWYEDIFREIMRRYGLASEIPVHNDLARNRVVMNFSQRGVRIEQVTRSLTVMIEQGHFGADLIVVDGFDFAEGDPDELAEFRRFAQEMGLEVWLSARAPAGAEVGAPGRVPGFLGPYLGLISIVVTLRPSDGHLLLQLIKDHDHSVTPDTDLELDPRTLLISS